MIHHLIFATALLLAPQAIADPSPSRDTPARHHHRHRVAPKKTSADIAQDNAAKTPPKISNKLLMTQPP